MIDEFTCRYIISQFVEDTQVTAKQLHLISKGRRTASVLFNIEKNRLFSIYSLFPNWKNNDWDNLIQTLEQNKWIFLEDETIRLTEKGLSINKEFKKVHPYINTIDSLEYAKTRWDVWARFIFINQVVSEYRHSNSRYYPYLTSITEQHQTKKWLKEHGSSLSSFSDQWMKEVYSFFYTLKDKQADLCVNLLVGHKQTGLTKRQILEKYRLSDSQLIILLTHLTEELRCYSQKDSPLLWDLVQTVHKENDLGLSSSTYQTMQLLENGKSIQHISQLRKLKESTIKDHILEMVLVQNWKGYKDLIPHNEYQAIHQLFDRRPHLLYSEVKSVREDVEFFWFRLIEIERMRRLD